MKRSLLLVLIGVLCLAQRARDDYRAAYGAWRQTDPNLEREASGGGAVIAQRADRMAAEAAKSAAARKAFLEGTLADEAQQVAALESLASGAEPSATGTKPDTQFLAAETARVARTIDTFANDPDKGIQQLKQALAREKLALEALNNAVAERKKSSDAVDAATATIGMARAKALEQSKAMLEGLQEASAGTRKEAEAWAEYYRKVGEAAQGEATPITVVPPGVPPATVNNPAPAPPTVTPVPLARYTGGWAYPLANGLYHGAMPESVDLTVNEENGHVTGTMSARFKLPAGSKDDPALLFEFSGDLQAARNQVFNLMTAEGAKGTIELIPGPAFNLLEVNFQTERKEGKIRQADFILVKK